MITNDLHVRVHDTSYGSIMVITFYTSSSVYDCHPLHISLPFYKVISNIQRATNKKKH